MARPDLNLQRLPTMLKQAAVSHIASVWVLLVMALLSSLYEIGIENSVLSSGFPFNLPNGNFSFDFDFRDKQNYSPPDGPSQRQKLILDGKGNALGASGQPGQEDESSVGRFLSSFFLPPAADEANGHLHDLMHSADDSTFVRASMESNEGQSEGVSGDQAEVQGNYELPEYEAVEEFLDYDDNNVKLKLVVQFGNVTKKGIIEDLEESGEVGIFAGRLFSGRVFDHQRAMPQGGGATALLILLLLLVLLAIFLGIIALQHSAVLGAVAFTVASTHMGKTVSITQSLRSGLRSGIWRLIWLAVLHGTLRGLQCLILMRVLFGNVLEMEQMERLVFRLSLMPFAVLAPWKDAYATDASMSLRIGAFVGLEYLFDGLAYSVYIMGCWVAIVERQYRGTETLYRGWSLVKSMGFQAATIKILESVICGRSFKWMLQQIVGQFLATLTVSFLQTYFLVLWFIFYFSARSKENQGQTRQFSHRNLEDFLERLQ